MRKSILAAAGGVLAAGCWLTAAPANAGPCEAPGFDGAACSACMRANPYAYYPNCESSRPPPVNGPAYGRDRACAESGICPGAAWVNHNGGLKMASCVHFPDDPPGQCAPVSPGAAGPAGPASCNSGGAYVSGQCAKDLYQQGQQDQQQQTPDPYAPAAPPPPNPNGAAPPPPQQQQVPWPLAINGGLCGGLAAVPLPQPPSCP